MTAFKLTTPFNGAQFRRTGRRAETNAIVVESVGAIGAAGIVMHQGRLADTRNATDFVRIKEKLR